MRDTLPLLELTDFPPINRRPLKTLQVNLGYRCNQRCLHCHVNASPDRTEMMSDETFALLLEVIDSRRVAMVDITGGAPELHPRFRELVRFCRARDIAVIDRCNLTILFEPGQEDLAEFLAEQRVEVVASLPCYSQANVDNQRGAGVFHKSIEALQRFNALGYGLAGSDGGELTLSLVYNPQGPSLPPDQTILEADYRRELRANFGIEFTRLLAIANMPIKRFGSTLVSRGEFVPYMALLRDNFQARNLDQVMCRDLVSVDWQGRLYDCDFNQQLGLPVVDHARPGRRPDLRTLLVEDLAGMPIATADHCYGCTAGQGSSCGGAL
ncbi:MAG: radical SAM protein [Porticoccaceae bacterium]|nr:radical SAM protein [Porticoccaceae bacterium]